jgi:hypothetical protein
LHETRAELRKLQDLLDRSMPGVDDPRHGLAHPPDAECLVGLLEGALELELTDAIRGRPLGTVEALFYRGEFWFGSARYSTVVHAVRRQTEMVATHRSDGCTITVLANARLTDINAPLHTPLRAYCVQTFGADWHAWGSDLPYVRLPAQRMEIALHSTPRNLESGEDAAVDRYD